MTNTKKDTLAAGQSLLPAPRPGRRQMTEFRVSAALRHLAAAGKVVFPAFEARIDRPALDGVDTGDRR